MAFDFKAVLRDKRAWAVAGIGAAGGLFLAARARRQGAGTATGGIYDPGAPAVTGQPSTYDSSLSDIWEGFTQTAGGLQGQIDEINAALEGNTPPSPTNNQTPPAPAIVPDYEIHKIKGTWNLRQLAARWAPSRDPNAIEATLRRIVALNPALKGKTSITTGGFDLRVPRVTRVA